MSVKLAVTVILGLALQLAQVLPAAFVTAPCGALPESCQCCVGARSCGCVENENSNQKLPPSPIETGRLLEIPIAKSTETQVSVDSPHGTHPCATTAVYPETESSVGYIGVRLSVAFCSFVI